MTPEQIEEEAYQAWEAWAKANPADSVGLGMAYYQRGFIHGYADGYMAGRNAGLEAAAIVNEELCRAVPFKSTGALLKAANDIRALKTAEAEGVK